jgi:hypothetical protein
MVKFNKNKSAVHMDALETVQQVCPVHSSLQDKCLHVNLFGIWDIFRAMADFDQNFIFSESASLLSQTLRTELGERVTETPKGPVDRHIKFALRIDGAIRQYHAAPSYESSLKVSVLIARSWCQKRREDDDSDNGTTRWWPATQRMVKNKETHTASARLVLQSGARTVLKGSGSPVLGLSKAACMGLTKEVGIQSSEDLLVNGPYKYPGAVYALSARGDKLWIEAMRDTNEAADFIKRNDIRIIGRHLQDGDEVVLSRPPFNSAQSLMVFKIKVIDTWSARAHCLILSAIDGDFDGDCVFVTLSTDLRLIENLKSHRVHMMLAFKSGGTAMASMLHGKLGLCLLAENTDTVLDRQSFHAVVNGLPCFQQHIFEHLHLQYVTWKDVVSLCLLCVPRNTKQIMFAPTIAPSVRDGVYCGGPIIVGDESNAWHRIIAAAYDPETAMSILFNLQNVGAVAAYVFSLPISMRRIFPPQILDSRQRELLTVLDFIPRPRPTENIASVRSFYHSFFQSVTEPVFESTWRGFDSGTLNLIDEQILQIENPTVFKEVQKKLQLHNKKRPRTAIANDVDYKMKTVPEAVNLAVGCPVGTASRLWVKSRPSQIIDDTLPSFFLHDRMACSVSMAAAVEASEYAYGSAQSKGLIERLGKLRQHICGALRDMTSVEGHIYGPAVIHTDVCEQCLARCKAVSCETTYPDIWMTGSMCIYCEHIRSGKPKRRLWVAASQVPLSLAHYSEMVLPRINIPSVCLPPPLKKNHDAPLWMLTCEKGDDEGDADSLLDIDCEARLTFEKDAHNSSEGDADSLTDCVEKDECAVCEGDADSLLDCDEKDECTVCEGDADSLLDCDEKDECTTVVCEEDVLGYFCGDLGIVAIMILRTDTELETVTTMTSGIFKDILHCPQYLRTSSASEQKLVCKHCRCLMGVQSNFRVTCADGVQDLRLFAKCGSCGWSSSRQTPYLYSKLDISLIKKWTAVIHKEGAAVINDGILLPVSTSHRIDIGDEFLRLELDPVILEKSGFDSVRQFCLMQTLQGWMTESHRVLVVSWNGQSCSGSTTPVVIVHVYGPSIPNIALKIKKMRGATLTKSEDGYVTEANVRPTDWHSPYSVVEGLTVSLDYNAIRKLHGIEVAHQAMIADNTSDGNTLGTALVIAGARCCGGSPLSIANVDKHKGNPIRSLSRRASSIASLGADVRAGNKEFLSATSAPLVSAVDQIELCDDLIDLPCSLRSGDGFYDTVNIPPTEAEINAALAVREAQLLGEGGDVAELARTEIDKGIFPVYVVKGTKRLRVTRRPRSDYWYCC